MKFDPEARLRSVAFHFPGESEQLESGQIAKMIGYDGIETLVENDIHGLDLNRITIAFEDIVDTFGRAVLPSIYLTVIAGLEKAVGVQFPVLIHVFGIAYNVVVCVLAGRRIEITDDQITSDPEMPA